MSIENPARPQEYKKKALFRLIESRVRIHIGNARQELPDLEAEKVYIHGLNRLEDKLIETIPEQKGPLSRLFESLKLESMDNEDDFIASVSEKITEFIAGTYTYDEIEQIARNNPRYKNIELNRLVVYGTTGDRLHLHVPVTFIENSIELAKLFIDAMKKLAIQIKTNPELAEIKTITAESWIVVRAQKALIKYGFTVTDIDLDRESGKAEISRDKLLEIYGE